MNSATHIWGSRRFQTRDDSTNNWWVAALSFGEGWHNNHHAHPTSARHGLAWYEFDFNWIGISTLKMLGLAWDVKVARIKQPVPYEENDTLVVDEAADGAGVASQASGPAGFRLKPGRLASSPEPTACATCRHTRGATRRRVESAA